MSTTIEQLTLVGDCAVCGDLATVWHRYGLGHDWEALHCTNCLADRGYDQDGIWMGDGYGYSDTSDGE